MTEPKKDDLHDRLIIQDLHTYIGDSHILQGCSLEVGEECVVLLGRNGMGKTTLLRSIMGLAPPRSGTIQWKQHVLNGVSPNKIASTGIGYVPQGRRLFPSLSVEEHLTLPHKKINSALSWTPERVFEFFPELADRRKISGSRLSGGEQQMLAIGRALVTNPEILLLDEPSEGLSPVAIDRVIEICHELLDANIAILLVEQNIHVAEALAERIYIILGGRTVYESDAHQFLEDTDLRQKYLGI
ncbi:MAG TPA: ABC transporter ATP-binding protein [Anaerolineales bacterium]|nr:ABC transporter ATP-binding protein [Anaerolineales bacterium]